MMLQDENNWAEEILNWYAEGDFDVEVAARLKVPLREFHKQMNENAAFGRLVDYGRTLCEAFWVGQAKSNLKNKSFNGGTWNFVMKNKFGWAERSEQTSLNEVNPNLNADELRQKITTEALEFLSKYNPEMEEAKKLLKLVSSKDE